VEPSIKLQLESPQVDKQRLAELETRQMPLMDFARKLYRETEERLDQYLTI
jgi:hypothetical protein